MPLRSQLTGGPLSPSSPRGPGPPLAPYKHTKWTYFNVICTVLQ